MPLFPPEYRAQFRILGLLLGIGVLLMAGLIGFVLVVPDWRIEKDKRMAERREACLTEVRGQIEEEVVIRWNTERRARWSGRATIGKCIEYEFACSWEPYGGPLSDVRVVGPVDTCEADGGRP